MRRRRVPVPPSDRWPPAPASGAGRWWGRVATAFLVVVPSLVAAVEARQAAWAMNPDGVALLDLAGAWRAGDMDAAISSYWSPLYPWLLALGLAGMAPAPQAEFPAVHAINAVIAIGVAAAGAALHRRLDHVLAGSGVGPAGRVALWVVLLLGLVRLVTIEAAPRQVTADAVLAGVLLLATATSVALVSGPASWQRWALLGALGGVAYLAKMPGLPLAVLLLGATVVAAPHAGARRWRGPRLAALALLLVVVPWAALISRQDGRVTLGTTAGLNAAWSVVGHAGGPSGGGAALPMVVADGPGSYPRWLAPQRFMGTSGVAWTPARQWLTTVGNVRGAVRLVAWMGALAACLALTLAWRPRDGRWRLAAVLALPSLGGVCMYLLSALEMRYVGAFLVLVPTAVLMALLTAPRHAPRRGWLFAALAGALVFQWRPLLAFPRTLTPDPPTDLHEEVPATLRSAGVGAGGAVAVVGDAFHAYWARTARVRIIATVDATAYGQASDSVRRLTALALAAAGARAMVFTGTVSAPEDSTVRAVVPLPVPRRQ